MQESDHRLEHLHCGLGRDGVVVAEIQPDDDFREGLDKGAFERGHGGAPVLSFTRPEWQGGLIFSELDKWTPHRGCCELIKEDFGDLRDVEPSQILFLGCLR